MSARDDEDYRYSPGNRAMRDAGYKRCQRWWMTQEQYELVAFLARQNASDIQRIKAKAARAAGRNA